MSHACWLTHLPFTTSTSSSSFTLPSTTTPEHAAQSGQHDPLREHPVHHAHLQALPVDKLRHQESLWRENLQSGGNPRTTTPTEGTVRRGVKKRKKTFLEANRTNIAKNENTEKNKNKNVAELSVVKHREQTGCLVTFTWMWIVLRVNEWSRYTIWSGGESARLGLDWLIRGEWKH